MVKDRKKSKVIAPKVEVNCDEETSVSLQLAKAGYCSGNPEKVLNLSVSTVLAAMNYELFLKHYEETFFELNKVE